VQHLRMLREVAKSMDYDSPEVKDFVNYINRQIRYTNDAVVMEAAKLGCESPFLSNKDLIEIIKILEPHLTTKSTIKKYSVLKIFHTILKTQSRKNLLLNVKEIEKVLEDNNTSLSSIAASILLRICSENYL
jgi:coatomer protein complex subunit gamma